MKIRVFNESGKPVIGVVMAMRNCGHDAQLISMGTDWSAVKAWRDENGGKLLYAGTDKEKRMQADYSFLPPHCECNIVKRAMDILSAIIGEDNGV